MIRTLIAGSILLVACSSTQGTATIEDAEQATATTAPDVGSSEQSTSEATTTQPSTNATSAQPTDEWGTVEQESIFWVQRGAGLEARVPGIVWSDQGCLVVDESILFFTETDMEPVVSADGRTITVWGETIEIGEYYVFGGGVSEGFRSSPRNQELPDSHPCKDRESLANVDGLVD